MHAKHLASALVSALACALLAVSCVQSPESPPIDRPPLEATDDDGDFGGDPDVGGSVGSSSVGDPAYSWSQPSGTPSDGAVGDSESEPDAASSGGDAMWGYSPPLPPVGGFRPSPPSHVTTLWVGAPYGAEDFRFNVVKKWDGKDGAGGRQTADKLFVFILRDVDTRHVIGGWTCPIDVMIPVQTRPEGYISPKQAALVTADVANVAVPAVSHSRTEWTGLSALFCQELRVKMNDVFDVKYRGYGARVSRWQR